MLPPRTAPTRWRHTRRALLACLGWAMLAGCDGQQAPATAGQAARDGAAVQGATATPSAAPAAGAFVEGKDYTVLERVRFEDSTGFEQPAEAFSVLLPKGWTRSGGILWKSPAACRGEMVSASWQAASPDGAMRFVALPIHAWNAASEPMMGQAMQIAASQGGCEVAGPVTAEQYLREVLVPRELQGATVTEVRENPEVIRLLDATAERARAELARYGGSPRTLNSAVIARLSWPDGSQGIAMVSVTSIVNNSQDPYSGAYQQLSNSSALERSYIRFPAARREEAERVLAMLKTSYRTNPAWQQAINGYFAELRQAQDRQHHVRMQAIADQTRANAQAHAQRMDAIRAQGAASTAAFNERMAGMDAQMRSWESTQQSQDRSHTAFVQAIREVETYRDGSGTVELGAGYENAWSRGDGTYILSNSPTFDPSSAFQDQAWQRMERTQP